MSGGLAGVRTMLSVPANRERLLASAARAGADAVLIDLEDSVPPAEKEAARATLALCLTDLDWSGTRVGVRMNAVTSPEADADAELLAAHAAELDFFMLAKVRSSRDAWDALEAIRRRRSSPGPPPMLALVEDVEGLVEATTVARVDGVAGLVLGPGDLSASQGMREGVLGLADDDVYRQMLWYHARMVVVLAARAAGIVALDGPEADLDDEDRLRREAARACLVGFDGKWVLHPRQLATVRDAFAAGALEREEAAAIIAAYEAAQREGVGAITVGGKMVDAATNRLARSIR